MVSEKVFSLFLIFVFLLGNINSIIVQLPKGEIRGHILKSENGNDYYAFQEIPYAAPPVGQNRLQVPKEAEAWTDTLDATKNTKVCYQFVTGYDNLNMSEDCLYVNVYTPEEPGSNNLLPVLIWIHGGSLVNGSGAFELYGPKYIMDHGVVVVTLNYRLGSFGFVGTDDGVIPLNLGLKDQRFAIEWVNENIQLFGGDPDHVTLVGESAGSLSVGYHLMGPWTDDKQLFHAVIMQSGTPISGILVQEVGTTTETAFQLGRAVDPSFTSNDTQELLKVLQNADASELFQTEIFGGAAIENDGPFSYPGFQAFLDGNYKNVPVLIGFNSEEWLITLFTRNDTFMELVDENPAELIRPIINMSPENRTNAGLLLKQLYTKNTSFMEDFGGFVRFTSDEYFITGTCKQIELASLHVPYYLYQFAYKGYLGGQMDMLPFLPEDVETVVHAEDLHYMWDDGNNSDLSKFPEEDQLMLHRYVKLWTNFVKYFNPTPEPDPLLANITWLPSNPSTTAYLNLNATLEMREHPRQYQQVNKIKEEYMEPPYVAF